MNMNRVNELLSSMNSFKKEKYLKDEVLSELFALQQELVGLTFDDGHTSSTDLKIWDVERHLEELNMEHGNIADDEVRIFKEESKTLCNLIKAEISGNRGEAKAFRTLQYIKTPKIILKNIELQDEDDRTELDAVVITPEMVTIIEVKNTHKNIFIDECGDYYRTGEFLKWDCSISNKMKLKEGLLRKVLIAGGFRDIKIRNIVVFTDNRIEVHNKYNQITTCFVSQINHLIENCVSDQRLSDYEMRQIESLIKDAANKEAYLVGFDVEKYKMDFAIAKSILEEASQNKEDDVILEIATSSKWNWLKKIFSKKRIGYVASIVISSIVTFWHQK